MGELQERARTGKRSTPPPGSIIWAINDDMIDSVNSRRLKKRRRQTVQAQRKTPADLGLFLLFFEIMQMTAKKSMKVA
jgi:hypothetical protein